MNLCEICHEPGTKVVDNIHLCADCNLTMQSGSRDSLMQTLGLLARLAKVEADLTKEKQRTWATEMFCRSVSSTHLYETQLADQQKRIADLEAMLGTIEVWYEIDIERETNARSTRLTSTEAAALVRVLKETRKVRSIQVITSRLEKVVEDPGNHVS